MARHIFNPIHPIRIIRTVGNPAGFGEDEVEEITVAELYSQRIDKTGFETGSEGQQYFRDRTWYKVKADIALFENTKFNELLAKFGVQPIGSPSIEIEKVYGSKAKVDDLIYDVTRRRRYKIVGVTQTMDDKYMILMGEATR